MPKISPVKPRDLIKFLNKEGFFEIRQKGSHKFFKHSDGRTTIVPFHSSKPIGKGLLRKIFNEIKISPQEFMNRKN
jgi:predicted RNA binding protein YcfA (HicA-like mRNA interferase family)